MLGFGGPVIIGELCDIISITFACLLPRSGKGGSRRGPGGLRWLYEERDMVRCIIHKVLIDLLTA